MRDRELHCAACETEMLFEAPPCEDGHDDEDCPELACTGCGSAIMTGPVAARVRLRRRGPRVAPRHRRAA
ncbi:hypothetical protein [Micromonospora sp. NPDC049679]|uniref:hypothetical protein n=1 Tax=Micromonospora sp. NPDC049679 TaxID=3155920 RepID=UPI003405BE95